MKKTKRIFINKTEISKNTNSYFIADIAANHDGSLEKAKDLIWMAKESGADAVKFQHFKAKSIVSDLGFKNLGGKLSHQTKWKESVYEIYEKYECNISWTEELLKTSRAAEIDFFTTPYDFDLVSQLNDFVPAYKIGSGDITWLEFISHIASQKKPVLLATGASSIDDVNRAVEAILNANDQLILMQCNTNYTGSIDNFKYINLRVLEYYSQIFPDIILGLSDHSPGHSAVLGAIALGARVIEKHFTDDTRLTGPDHAFSMDPITWRDMVIRSRELENALGDGVKKVEENEMESVIVQQRCLRLKRGIKKGGIVSRDDIEVLRPAPFEALRPYMINLVIDKKLRISKKAGEAIYSSDLEDKGD